MAQVQCCDQLSSQGLENKVLWDGKRAKSHSHVLKKIPCIIHEEIQVSWDTMN